jgi:hypothetical protein
VHGFIRGEDWLRALSVLKIGWKQVDSTCA